MDATPNEQLDERIAKRKRQNAARVKRFRERKARGGVAFRVDLDGDDVAKLVTIGLLTEAQRHDPAAVKVAALKLIKAQATNAAANAAQSATPGLHRALTGLSIVAINAAVSLVAWRRFWSTARRFYFISNAGRPGVTRIET
jgi:hypothetical protein